MSDWRRMCIDSRYKTADSVSNADFYIQLPWPVTVPAGSQLFIDVVCSHSGNTVITGPSDTLYMKEVVSGTTEWRKLVDSRRLLRPYINHAFKGIVEHKYYNDHIILERCVCIRPSYSFHFYTTIHRCGHNVFTR